MLEFALCCRQQFLALQTMTILAKLLRLGFTRSHVPSPLSWIWVLFILESIYTQTPLLAYLRQTTKAFFWLLAKAHVTYVFWMFLHLVRSFHGACFALTSQLHFQPLGQSVWKGWVPTLHCMWNLCFSGFSSLLLRVGQFMSIHVNSHRHYH
jgi:hypothetical protein